MAFRVYKLITWKENTTHWSKASLSSPAMQGRVEKTQIITFTPPSTRWMDINTLQFEKHRTPHPSVHTLIHLLAERWRYILKDPIIFWIQAIDPACLEWPHEAAQQTVPTHYHAWLRYMEVPQKWQIISTRRVTGKHWSQQSSTIAIITWNRMQITQAIEIEPRYRNRTKRNTAQRNQGDNQGE